MSLKLKKDYQQLLVFFIFQTRKLMKNCLLQNEIIQFQAEYKTDRKE